MTYIYVKYKAIADNAYSKTAPPFPPVVIDRDGKIEMAFGAEIKGPSRVVYSRFTTREGAHVRIETDSEVVAITQ